jgi:CheY-like chemotaxis protein
MESVGRLAGGVAHDFNNILQMMMGYGAMLHDALPPDSELREYSREIAEGVDRAAALTRQLLAFARKQTISPKVLDLNETVESMLKMLRRLIGEDIDLVWQPEARLWAVLLDPGQIDQILANLCVNARDAIGGVGRVTIETGNATFDEDYLADHPDFAVGEYVLLAVSDDGCGMDRETRDKIFEPFFTTKGVGEGTGLGLATVYGIVKQNDGFIHVYSEPGKGATFRIYLPRHAADTAEPAPTTPDRIQQGLGEIILFLEDDPAILNLGRRMLTSLGYDVYAASTPAEALALLEQHNGNFHLLITDVVMPAMNGRELADQARLLCPAIKILFMSGYTANVIAHRGILDEGTNFIPKPFSLTQLAAKVRDVLNAPA